MKTERPSGCVLLADRHHGFTEALRTLLETEFGSVVMVAGVASLVDAAARLRPELAIVNQSLDPAGGLGWLEAIRKGCPGMKVIVLSVHDEQSVRQAVMKAGADGFVLKRAVSTDLLPVVERVRATHDPEPPLP